MATAGVEIHEGRAAARREGLKMPKFTSYVQGTPNWVELMAPDQQAAAAFYADLFGWEVETNPVDDDGNVYLIGRKDGEQIAGFMAQMPELAGSPAFWGVYLAVDDVDAATARIEQAGGKIDAGPFDVMEFGRMTALQDPTGARVSLWQAKSHIGTGLANEPGTPIWNELVTPDIERALAFYAEVIGLGSQEMEMPDGSYTVITNTAGEVVGGAMPPMMEGLPPHWNLYFNVTDTEATAARIAELGGTTLAPNFDVPGVGRMGFYADSQGAAFAIMQSPSEE